MSINGEAMDNYDLIYKILFSFSLGFLIGLEREYKVKEQIFAGIRTFPLISILGFLSSFISDKYWEGALYISFIAVVSFSLVNFYLEFNKDKGVTTEISILITFLIGVLTYFNQYYLALFITFSTTLILALKKPLEDFAKSLYFEDVITLIKFGILTVVVFPILPDKNFGPYEAFNLKEIWKVVIIVATIDFIGYILLRWKGSKSLLLVGIFGGLISSTAVTYNFSVMSKNLENKNVLSSGIIGSWIVMNLRVIVLTLLLNIYLAILVMPFLLTLSFIQLFFLRKYYTYNNIDIDDKKPFYNETFSITSILTFAFIYALVVFLIKVMKVYLGNIGIYFVSLISGVIDVDAVVLSVSNLTNLNSININTGLLAIFLAVLSNTIFKYVYILIFADKTLKVQLTKTTAITVIFLFISIIFNIVF